MKKNTHKDNISDFWLKKIGKMIESEDTNGFYKINDRFTPTMLDMDLIEIRNWCELHGDYRCIFSAYFVTKKGREIYKEWKNKNSKSAPVVEPEFVEEALRNLPTPKNVHNIFSKNN